MSAPRGVAFVTLLAGGLGLAGVSAGACTQILGVTDGLPYPDGGGDEAIRPPVDAARASNDVEAAAIRDAGAPDCGSTKSTCEGRCGKIKDDCGHTVDCLGCEAGLQCMHGACGCMPDSISVTCQGHNCGMFEDNCGQSVACGSHGTKQCEHPTDICEPDSSTCCTPDTPDVTCNGQCGVTLTNNCGQSIGCSCDDSGVCVSGVCCGPVSEAEWCANRCGTLDNNCGQTVNCGGCEAGVCNNNSCDCNPDPPEKTCASTSCGLVQNNCAQFVPCGISGTTDCPKGQVCESDSGACCTPELVATACEEAGASCGNVKNNCGTSVQCNDTCAAEGGACAVGEAGPNACCVDDGTACDGLSCGAATNNCGRPVGCTNACAYDQSCSDGGSCCNVNGTACLESDDCCDRNCNVNDAGTSSCCNVSGAACGAAGDCCSASCDADARICN